MDMEANVIWRTMDRYWRVFATGFCFSIFGIGGLVLSFIIIPFLRVTSSEKLELEAKVQGVIQQQFHFFCLLMRWTGAIDYRITGAEILAEDENCLVVANHPSLIDYVLIASQIKRCDCLVKSAIWRNPFIKHVVRGAGYIPNDGNPDFLQQCEARFNLGNVLLIFPEGTRTSVGKDAKLQRGAAQIAARTGRDIRVVHITVSPSFLTKEQKWYQVPDVKPFFHVEVKDKLKVAPIIEQAKSPTIAARRIQKQLACVLFPTTNNTKVGSSGSFTKQHQAAHH